MININTIISSFDEEGTLLKWLKKVEDALKNASLKTVETVTIDDTSFQLKFVFADDTFLLSPSITSPQGVQGPVGPQGPQGEQGPQGPAGKDANKAELLDNATLEVKKSSDGTPIINLVAEFGDKTKVNSTAKFNRGDFDIQNGHISLNEAIRPCPLYIHNVEIHATNKDANITILNTANFSIDTADILAEMLNKEGNYSALLTGTIIDKNHSKSFQLNDFNVNEAVNSVFLYYIDSSNQKNNILVDHTAEVVDTHNQLL